MPLYAAIAGCHWETAKLVLVIAAAQHHPKNDEKKFTVNEVRLGEVTPTQSILRTAKLRTFKR